MPSISTLQKQRKTGNTQERYDYVARLLIERALKDGYAIYPGHLRGIVNWLENKRQELAPAAFRQYKAALVHHFEWRSWFDFAYGELLLMQAYSPPEDERQTRVKRTSAQKLKYFPKECLDALIEVLAEVSHDSGRHVLLWLLMGILFGLRPNEWWTVKIIDLRPRGIPLRYLRVRNAKYTNGRSHGRYRRRPIDGLDQAELALLGDHLAVIERNRNTESDPNKQQRHYWRCAKVLQRACRKLWPARKRHPTLYSTRHQFSSDGKKAGIPTAELAAIMGHAAERTVGIYGRKRYGQKSRGKGPDQQTSRFRALASEVAKVRRRSSKPKEVAQLPLDVVFDTPARTAPSPFRRPRM